jgi:hypothetical protein
MPTIAWGGNADFLPGDHLTVGLYSEAGDLIGETEIVVLALPLHQVVTCQAVSSWTGRVRMRLQDEYGGLVGWATYGHLHIEAGDHVTIILQVKG